MIDFDSLQREALEKQIKVFPQHKLRASSMGDECERRMFYSIKNWEDRIPHDHVLQSIFNVGNVMEEHYAMPLLNKFRGMRVIETGASYMLRDPDVSGHIDGKILIEETNEYIDAPVGSKIPVELKTVTQFDWAKLNTIEDFTKSKKHHQRGYVSQIQLYLLGTGEEYGYMVLINKITGQLKFIKVTIDIDFCDELVKKAQRVEKAIATNTPAERVDDIELCQRCAFRQICMPTMKFDAVKIMDKDELIALLQERDELKASVDRYKEVDEEAKDQLKAQGAGQYIVGEWAAKVVERERKAYSVEPSKYLDTRIARLK